MLDEKQLAKRRKGITATDASAIVGENPWRRPIDVYLSKKGIEAPMSKEAEERALTGSILEAGLAQRYLAHQAPQSEKWRILQPRQTLHNPDVPWIMATPDRFIFEVPEGDKLSPTDMARASKCYPAQCSHLLECKLVGRPAGHWDTSAHDLEDEDRLPAYVYVQVQWQAIVTGVQRIDVAVLLNGTDYHTLKVPVDHDYCRELINVCYQFYTEHVLADVAPEPDGSASFTRYLNTICPQNLVDVAEKSEDAALATLVEQYCACRSVESAAKADKERLGQLIKNVIRDRAGFIGQWGKATWLTNAGTPNYSKMIADLGIDAATVNKYRTPSRTLRVTGRKEKP